MIVVHHLNNSRSQRILWMLEELGLDYEIKRYERERSMQAPASLRAVHPLGKSPVITDGDKTIAESGAILEYLNETYGGGKFSPPPGTTERLHYTYFMHYAEGSLMPLLVMKLIFSRTTVAPTPWLIRPIAKAIAHGVGQGYLDPSLKLHLSSIETALGDSGWFAGSELTAADIIMSFPLEAAAARGGASQGYPNILSFLARIKARPGWQAALGKGGPYQLMR